MIGKIKMLGMAFVAMAALSASSASAVQAGELDIGLSPASVFAKSEVNQLHVFTLTTTGGSKFNTTCPADTFEGTTQGLKITEATVTPTYSDATKDCTGFSLNAPVRMNGCKYTITGSGHASNTFTIDIVGCTSGKKIEIITAVCTLDIPEQNGLSHFVGTNLTAQEVTLSQTVTGIKVQQTGAGCPDGNLHTGTGMSFTGNTILKAREDKGGALVTKHAHQYQELSQAGAQTTVATT